MSYLATSVLSVSRQIVERDYIAVQRRLLEHPERYGWIVNGQMAAYCDEGAFILNTTTMQYLLGAKPAYRTEVGRRFSNGEYEPVMACVNQLFHKFTSGLPPYFREDCVPTLTRLLEMDTVDPVILTNSRGDKVRRNLTELGVPLLPAHTPANDGRGIRILGDVRQYDMSLVWPPASEELEAFSRIDGLRKVDLRRPVYYRALMRERLDVDHLIIVADGYSLAGSLPLALGIPFFLVKASYTPDWMIRYVEKHPLGSVLEELKDLLEQVESLML